MSYVVTNKWMRAGYGEPLRAFFAKESAIEQIIDFGHAPIFEDADVFPCIIVLKKTLPDGNGQQDDHQVQVTAFPREALKLVQLDGHVRKYGHPVPQARFGTAPWSLETSDVDDLMAKIKRAGVPLAEFAGVKPYYGIKTGLNEAFLIDTPTKERLVREDPRSAELIKPYLRGQDIKRWSPDWDGLWMIVMKSSTDYSWPWSDAGDASEDVFGNIYPALYQHLKPFEDRLRTRQDKWIHWWELRPCDYYSIFQSRKFVIQRIAFHSRIGFDVAGTFINDAAIMLPTTDFWLLTCMNSPPIWSYQFRNFPHKKDEALAMDIPYVEVLPIAAPTDAIRAEVEPAVERLIAITRVNQETRHDTLDWLRTEFDVEAPGQKLEGFAGLDAVAFVEEVRKRRAKSASRLSPAALRALREGYAQQAAPVQQRQAEALRLERRLADLVNQAYGLTPEEIDLLWRTAPPRMPVRRS
jgi:uncharacterized membrane protein